MNHESQDFRPKSSTGDAAEIAHALLKHGYAPLPLPYGHKKCARENWPSYRATAENVERDFSGRHNVALLTAAPPAVDIDVLDPDLAAELDAEAQRRWPGALRRIGQAPKVVLICRAEALFRKQTTQRYFLPRGGKAEVEILASGQQCVVFGKHPDTGEDCRWLGATPMDVAREALPEITEAEARDFVKYARARITAVGGAPEKKPEADRSHSSKHSRSRAEGIRIDVGGDYFANVNRAALKSLDRWVREVFPSAALQTGTGAWRISSRDLGRALEEDLSFHPEGIYDFGEERGLTPIDAVMNFGSVPSVIRAADWLCEKMGIDPAVLGRKPSHQSRVDGGTGFDTDAKTAAQGGSAPPGGNGDEIEVTEDGIARLFSQRHGQTMLFDHDAGSWYRWAGAYWKRDTTHRAFSYCRELAHLGSKALEERDRAKARKASFAGGVERFARCDPAHAVTQGHWDRHPFLLGTPSVTIDLRTGEARKPDPVDAITRQAGTAPSATAECVHWLAFLREATGGDAEMVRCLQLLAGYSLTGDTTEHKLFFIYGPGGNGKSVFLNVLLAILGDYGQTAAMDTFTASNSDRYPTDLAALRGASLVTATETEEGRAWAESRIKQLTGGDPISARFMRRDFFTFKPQLKLLFAGNHKPVLRNLEPAARRRFDLIPFTRKPQRPDPQLEAKLLGEAPGILRWMIDGCLAWQAGGLTCPAAVERETAGYFNDQDVFAQWLEDECVVERENSHRWQTSAELFASWTAYAKAAGEEPGTAKRFGETMRRAGFERSQKRLQSQTPKVWIGLSLRVKTSSHHDG